MPDLLDDNNDNDNNINDDYYYVFWLMPTERDAQLLRDTIMRDLREEFQHAVEFEPHVTLAPPVPASAIPNPKAALTHLASALLASQDENSHNPHHTKNLRSTNLPTPLLEGNSSEKDHRTVLTLSDARVNYGTRYTQSIFLQFQGTPMLRELYNTACQISGLPPITHEKIPATDHFPHLSVLYESCCEMAREAAAARVQLNLEQQQQPLAHQHISFDAVQLVRIQLPVEGPDDVRLWKSMGTAPLLLR